MTDAVEYLRRTLAERGPELLGVPGPVTLMSTRRRNSALIAELASPAGTLSVVVKRLEPDLDGDYLARQREVHARLRESDGELAQHLPEWLLVDPEQRILMRRFIEGRDLATVLRRSLVGYEASAARNLLRTVGRCLARLHDFHLDTLPPPGVRLRARHLEGMRMSWPQHAVVRHLPPAYRDPTILLGRLRAGFADAAADGLLSVDAQPKNVIVADAGRVFLIDIGYVVAPTGLNLGPFLVALDMESFCALDLGQHRRITLDWQRSFLEGYQGGCRASEWLWDEVVFYYPKALLGMCDAHISRRRWAAAHLSRVYASKLVRFIERLERVSDSHAGRDVLALFAAP
jgi:tRNA A-37 threonylcarbamoyl transferase component Bud32